eukprot:TRINITY_DN32602_c0_g1_i1.p1 TRINITY_DN32602_c0_g1~~TRINITY_DN32602_c0_g1_i1.p1  ORF type:complete len:251 (-),score=38.35 TRINITY_DN32602_c0_g1_i1:136-888(-)
MASIRNRFCHANMLLLLLIWQVLHHLESRSAEAWTSNNTWKHVRCLGSSRPQVAGRHGHAGFIARSVFNLPNFWGPGPEIELAKNRLLEKAAVTGRGTKASDEDRKEIEQLIDDLVEAAGGPPEEVEFTGRWHLVYTTEKEILFLFGDGEGKEATEAYQSIEISKGTLGNEVVWANGVDFTVASSLQVSGRRSSFEFQGAALQVPGWPKLSLPPVGKGWFDTLFIDGDIRVVRDIRGDTGIYERDNRAVA